MRGQNICGDLEQEQHGILMAHSNNQPLRIHIKRTARIHEPYRNLRVCGYGPAIQLCHKYEILLPLANNVKHLNQLPGVMWIQKEQQ